MVIQPFMLSAVPAPVPMMRTRTSSAQPTRYAGNAAHSRKRTDRRVTTRNAVMPIASHVNCRIHAFATAALGTSVCPAL